MHHQIQSLMSVTKQTVSVVLLIPLYSLQTLEALSEALKLGSFCKIKPEP